MKELILCPVGLFGFGMPIFVNLINDCRCSKLIMLLKLLPYRLNSETTVLLVGEVPGPDSQEPLMVFAIPFFHWCSGNLVTE